MVTAMMGRSVWDRAVVGPLMERSMRGVEPLRAALLKTARGRIVEIGFGTGANLPFYPDSVTELVAVEPSTGLIERAHERLETWGRPYAIVPASATHALPLEAHSFDAAVMTFVLCSVPDVKAVLEQTARLLKPGAPLLLAEHVAAGSRGWRCMQHVMRPFSKAIAGCDPTRDTGATLVALSWDTRDLRPQSIDLMRPYHTGLVGVVRAPLEHS